MCTHLALLMDPREFLVRQITSIKMCVYSRAIGTERSKLFKSKHLYNRYTVT